MRRVTLGACALALLTPAAAALAGSAPNPNLPAGEANVRGDGYVYVQYSKKLRRISYVQLYYRCAAAGPRHSKYPGYISLTTRKRVVIHRGRAAGRFTSKINDPIDDPRATGETARVSWTVRDLEMHAAGLSGKLHVKVTGPANTCPFSFSNRRLIPFADVP